MGGGKYRLYLCHHLHQKSILVFQYFVGSFYFLPFHTKGTPQITVTFWRAGPLKYRLPLLGECSRSPSVSVYQQPFLWEAAFSFSEFFKDNFKGFAHFTTGDLRAHLSTMHWVFSTFWPKMPWPACPTLPSHLVSPWENSLLPWMKSPQRETFYWYRRGETKKRQKH